MKVKRIDTNAIIPPNLNVMAFLKSRRYKHLPEAVLIYVSTNLRK